MKPWSLAFGVLIAPALLVHLGPDSLRESLLYQRDALQRGEFWRAITGHWVHFNTPHLVTNLVALVLITTSLTRDSRLGFGSFLLIAPGAISGLLWRLEPNLVTYGGLSGLATGCATLLALLRIKAASSFNARLPWIAALLALAAKSAADLFSCALLPHVFADSVRVSTWAHASGAIVASVYFGICHALLRPKSAPFRTNVHAA